MLWWKAGEAGGLPPRPVRCPLSAPPWRPQVRQLLDCLAPGGSNSYRIDLLTRHYEQVRARST
jgi:hypothetical protein